MNNFLKYIKKYKLLKFLPILYTLTIFILSIIPGKYDPAQDISDKLKHAFAFFIFFLLYSLFFNLNKKKIFLIGFIFGIFIEFIQYFIPYRSCDMKDVIADATGLLIAYFIF